MLMLCYSCVNDVPSDGRLTVAVLFCMQHKKRVDASSVPLLAFDISDSRNGKPPFRLAEDAPPDTASLCSCTNLADRANQPLHVMCEVCPY